MKILLLGGYGVFGERLARLLVRDGHDVCIAGRNTASAQALADELGCRSLMMDRNGNLGGLRDFDVVIDAAGPFHDYGNDPYRLAKAAIAAGVHYLDLSDNAAFCAGISALDAQATKAGVCVLSGLSSVPALSSAAVRALAGKNRPLEIDTAILPGNRAPRGLSVMHSILAQAGRPIPVWRGNRWERGFGWSDPANYDLPDGVIRQGWQIEVPDLQLFPAHFGAGTVRFRAGLELAVMRYGLAGFATLRRVLPLPVTRPVVRAFKMMADMLAPFGTGRGGMSVTVTTQAGRQTWRLLAEDGDGPFIPSVPARALLRRPDLPIGAGPALEVITLAEAEAAMSDLRVVTDRRSEPLCRIFPRVLKVSFDRLPDSVRETHLTVDKSRWQGRCEVQRGRGVWSGLLCALFGFPAAGEDVTVEVTKTATPAGETWDRLIGGRRFRSYLAATDRGMTERFGPFTFLLGLEVQDGALIYPVLAGRMGPVRLPGWLLPKSVAREFEAEGRFNFDVAIYAPITKRLIIRYQGHLTPMAGDRPTLSMPVHVAHENIACAVDRLD